LLSHFIRWLRRQFHTAPPSVWPRRLAEPPEAAESGVVYLVGESSVPWCAILRCPCGCGDVISLSLIASDRPRWRARNFWDGTVSLHPSVWRTKGCRSHFFVVRSRVIWVTEELH
jgi:hypothetical protein